MKTTLRRVVIASLALLGAALPLAAEIHDLEFASLAQYRGFTPLFGRPGARLGDGSYAVVWTEAFQEARLQWVRPDGSQILPPGGLSLGRTWARGNPVAAPHAGGGAYVAIPLATADGSRIVVQSFDRNASPRWGAGVVAIDAPGVEYQTGPQILTSADGGAFVCFLRGATPTAAGATVCQRLSADGHALWAGGRVAEANPGSQSALPILLPDAANGLLVFWTVPVSTVPIGGALPATSTDLQNPISVKGQRFGPDGSPLWGSAGKVLHVTNWWEPGFTSIRTFAVSDGHGGAILAFPDWQVQTAPPLVLSVVAQRVNGDGVALWGGGTTIATGPDYPTIDSLTATPNGGAAAVLSKWLGNSQFQLVLFRLAPGGRVRPAQPVVLSRTDRAGQQDFGSQDSFDGDRLRILWSSRGVFESFPTEVRMAVFDGTGQRLTPADAPPLVGETAGKGHTFAGFLFDVRRNQGLALWTDYTLSDFLSAPAGALFSGTP
jgi:hypothetical protein